MNMPEKIHLFRGSREIMLSTPWQAPVEQFESSEMMMCCRFNSTGMNFSGAEGHVLRAVVAHIILSRRERAFWREIPGPEKRRTEWLFTRIAGKEAVRLLLRKRYGMEVWSADIEIIEDKDGKPSVRGQWIGQIDSAPSISLAHSKDMAIALAVDGTEALRCGIAMEPLRNLDAAAKRSAFASEERESILSQVGSEADEWTLRVLCAREAMAKALETNAPDGPRDLKLRDLDLETGSVTLEASGQIASEISHATGHLLQAYSFCEEGFIYASTAFEEKILKK
jgi:phosphopantetheinyl transferase (holo-ACP synthase)